jgi:hypothetical protein
MSGGSIVVDYEELRRMSQVWAAAARSFASQALSVASLAAESCLVSNAVFDPIGAVRAETSIVAAAAVPHGLAALSARFAVDGLALEATVLKEQVVDDFPLRALADFDEWLATAAVRFPFAPGRTLHDGRQDLTQMGNAMLGYLSPFAEPLLTLFAPSPRFRADAAGRRPLTIEPFFGLPLALVGAVAPDGPGSASISRYQPVWVNTAPGSLGSVLRRIADLEAAPQAALAVERVLGQDGVPRYVVELPGMRHMGVATDPQDLSGSIAAMALPTTAYMRCVGEALDSGGAPRGAEVVLVGHSEGGIVAMDLAGDPSFNGGRVTVTHVVAAGSPISSKQVAPASATRVFSVENVNDVVTHLDAVDSGVAAQSTRRLPYQFSADRHDVAGTHDPMGYAEQLDALADSPNPLLRDFESGVAPYLTGATTTTVFTLGDAPSG